MGLSIVLREDILNAVFRGTALPSLPTNYYVALLTTNPTDDTGAGAVEVSTGTWSNYARKPIANSTAGFSAPPGGTASPQSISNAAIVDFLTAATSANVTVTGFAFYDAATAGVFYGWAAFSAPQPIVQNGDPVSFAAGALVVNM